MKDQKFYHWVSATLLNDENSSDNEMLQYFMEQGKMSLSEARFYVAQRNDAISHDMNFELKRWAGADKRNPGTYPSGYQRGTPYTYTDEQVLSEFKKVKDERARYESKHGPLGIPKAEYFSALLDQIIQRKLKRNPHFVVDRNNKVMKIFKGHPINTYDQAKAYFEKTPSAHGTYFIHPSEKLKTGETLSDIYLRFGATESMPPRRNPGHGFVKHEFLPTGWTRNKVLSLTSQQLDDSIQYLKDATRYQGPDRQVEKNLLKMMIGVKNMKTRRNPGRRHCRRNPVWFGIPLWIWLVGGGLTLQQVVSWFRSKTGVLETGWKTMGGISEGLPYLTAGAVTALTNKYFVPPEQEGMKMGTTLASLGLIGFGVYKMIEEKKG